MDLWSDTSSAESKSSSSSSFSSVAWDASALPEAGADRKLPHSSRSRELSTETELCSFSLQGEALLGSVDLSLVFLPGESLHLRLAFSTSCGFADHKHPPAPSSRGRVPPSGNLPTGHHSTLQTIVLHVHNRHQVAYIRTPFQTERRVSHFLPPPPHTRMCDHLFWH